jgi:hypothetical protein
MIVDFDPSFVFYHDRRDGHDFRPWMKGDSGHRPEISARCSFKCTRRQ